MDRLEQLQEKLVDFRDDRGWEKYHNPKDLSISISLESSELLELYQWKDARPEDVSRGRIEEELADVFIYLLYLAEIYDVDLIEAADRKIDSNEESYPKDEYHSDDKPW